MNDNLIKRLPNLLQTATSGPWTHHERGTNRHPHPYVCGHEFPPEFEGDMFVVAYAVGMKNDANAELIALAPELATEVLALRTALEVAESKMEKAAELLAGIEKSLSGISGFFFDTFPRKEIRAILDEIEKGEPK